MRIDKKLKEQVIKIWNGLSANQQISVLIFVATFASFMRYGRLFYESIELKYVMNTEASNVLPYLFNLFLVVIIAWIIYIIIFQISKLLDILSSKNIAKGLNFALVSYFGFFVFSSFFFFILPGELIFGTTLEITWRAMLGIFLAFGVSNTWYGSINLIKSLIKWLTTNDENMKIEQKSILTLTFIGVIISLIALFG